MSEIVRDFDSQYEGPDPLESVIVDLIESIHVSTPEERWVSDEAVFTVAERSLTASASLPQGVRHFNAVRDVNSFLSLASVGLPSSGKADNTDLLPISHPASTALTALSASALREARAVWIASDPRITDETVRSIVASVYSSNPTSIEFTYHLTRMQMLSLEELPADIHLMPMVAFGNPFAGKNASVYRAARARAQRRDRYGRFAYMGGGIRFYAKKRNGQIVSIVGKVAGNSTDANGIDIEIKDVPGFKDGIYTVPSNVTEMIEAVLPEHAASKIANVQQYSDVPYVDVANMIPKALPDNWAPTKVAGEVAGLTPESATGHFVSADGYEVNAYHNESDSLKQRVEDAINKFGAQIVGPTGTDVLDPSQPVYEVISSKRGQNEVVGYAQDWASIQQLAANEDEAHPGVENEPVEQEMAGKKKPEVPAEEPVEKKATKAKKATPEAEAPAVEATPVVDPKKNIPAGWKLVQDENKKRYYSFENGKYRAYFGKHIIGVDFYDKIDPLSNEAVKEIKNQIADNAFAVFRGDSNSDLPENRVAIAYTWDAVEDARQRDTNLNGEPEQEKLSTAQDDNHINPPLVDKAQYATPTEQQLNAANGQSPVPSPEYRPQSNENAWPVISKLSGISSAIYNAMRHHDVTDPGLIDTYDHYMSHPSEYTGAEASALLVSIKKAPALSAATPYADYPYWMPTLREKIRRAIHVDVGDALSKSEKEDYDSRYRAIRSNKDLDAMLKEINDKKRLEHEKNVEQNATPEDTSERGYSLAYPTEKPAFALKPTFVDTIKAVAVKKDFSKYPDILENLDAAVANPEKYDYRSVNDLIKFVDSHSDEIPARVSKSATAVDRNLLRTAVAKIQVAGVSDAVMSQLNDWVDPARMAEYSSSDIKNIMNTLTDLAQTGIAGQSTGTRIHVLGSDNTTNGPSSKIISDVQRLVDTKDIPEDLLNQFLENHRTMPAIQWQFYKQQFEAFPDKTVDAVTKPATAPTAEPVKTEAEAEPQAETEEPGVDTERLKGAVREAANFYHNLLVNGASAGAKQAAAYLQSRGFNLDDVKHFKLGYAPKADKGVGLLLSHLKSKGYTDNEIVAAGLAAPGTKDPSKVYDSYQGRIVWPIKDVNGVPVGFNARAVSDKDITDQNPKYRNPKTTDIYKKSNNLYNLDLAKDSIKKTGQAIVVEGYTNIMALHKAGYDNVVSTSGVSFSPEQLKALIASAGENGLKEVVMAYDPDDAGRKGVEEATKLLKEAGIKVSTVSLPENQDIADTFLKEGADKLKQVIDERQVISAPSAARTVATPETPVSTHNPVNGLHLDSTLMDYYGIAGAPDNTSDNIGDILVSMAKEGMPTLDLIKKLPVWYITRPDDSFVPPFHSMYDELSKYASIPTNEYDVAKYKGYLSQLQKELASIATQIGKKHPEYEDDEDLIVHIANLLLAGTQSNTPAATPETPATPERTPGSASPTGNSRAVAIEKAARSAALNADAKMFRSELNGAIVSLSRVLDGIKSNKLFAGIVPLLEGPISDLSALQSLMTKRNKPSAADINRELNLIIDGMTGNGASLPYGKMPELNDMAEGIVHSLAMQLRPLVGSYNEGKVGAASNVTGKEDFDQEMAAFSNAPRMRRVDPPSFWGPEFDKLSSSQEWQDLIDHLSGKEFYIVDLETTGLPDLENPDIKNDIVQLAVIKVNGLKQTEMFKTYINPESEISSYTLNTVGDGKGGKVTKEFLSKQPTKKEALQQLLDFIPQGSLVAGHNLMQFDMDVINRSLREADLPELQANGILDTLGMARHVMPEWSPQNPDAPYKLDRYGNQVPSKRLEDLVTYFGLSNNGRHEADADIISTLEVLNHMLEFAASGKAKTGSKFSLSDSANGYTQEDYDSAVADYEQAQREYRASRLAERLLFLGDSALPGEADEDIANLIRMVENIDSGVPVSDPVSTTDLPAPAVLSDIPAGTYVLDIRSRRVGKSYGSADGNKALVEFQAADYLVSGKTSMEYVIPSTVAPITSRFMSKNGVILDHGMGVTSTDTEGTWRVSSLFDANKVILSNGKDQFISSPENITVVSNGGLTPASTAQEHRIINASNDLEKLGIIDKVTANAYQTAATEHYYSLDSAKSLIGRLLLARSQQLTANANDEAGVELPKARRAARFDLEQEMASKKPKLDNLMPKDKITVAALRKKVFNWAYLDGKLKFPPNQEVKDALQSVYSGYDVVLQALAGTGKTTTLQMIVQMFKALDKKLNFLYIVFNKENQVEAEKALGNLAESRTSDSISFGANANKIMRAKFQSQNENAGLNKQVPLTAPEALADHLGLAMDQQRLATANYVSDGLHNWVISDDDKIDFKHFKEYANDHDGELPKDPMLLMYVQMLWADLTSEYDPEINQVVVDFDHMFKNWALTKPDFTATDGKGNSLHGFQDIPKILLLDEAQDINPVFRKIILDQRDLHANKIQIVTVGDGNQAIYGFRGSEDALTKIYRDITLPLTQSYRSGKGIVDFTNNILNAKGERQKLRPRPDRDSNIVAPGSLLGKDNVMYISRTNAGVVETLHVAGSMIEEYKDKHGAVTDAFKMRLYKVITNLQYLYNLDKAETTGRMVYPIRPQDRAAELRGYQSYAQVTQAKDHGGGNPTVNMVLNLVNSMKSSELFKEGEDVPDFLTDLAKASEQGREFAGYGGVYSYLKDLVSRARVKNTNFEVPKKIGSVGSLGGGIQYSIKNGVVTLSPNNKRAPMQTMAWDLGDMRHAIEDNGFTRSEEIRTDSNGNPVVGSDGTPRKVFAWEKNIGKKNVEKVLTDLVKSLTGQDAVYMALTGHTSKGLEDDNVMLWRDWPTPSSLKNDLEKAEKNGKDTDVAKDWRAPEESNLAYVGASRPRFNLDPGPLVFYQNTPQEELVREFQNYREANNLPTLDVSAVEEPTEQEMASYGKATAMDNIDHYQNMLQDLEEGKYVPEAIHQMDPFDPLFSKNKEILKDQERSRILGEISRYQESLQDAKLEEESKG